MIKKIALLIISALFIFATYNVYSKGLSVGQIDALSYNEITTKNTQLNNEIGKLDNLNKNQYTSTLGRLESAEDTFNKTKKAYEQLASTASESEIAEVNKEEKYLLDYLWIKIGNYANENNIKVLIDYMENDRKINFDVSGPYISIINFIYDLENDSELAFDVDNIIMEGASTASDAKATFTVSNVLVELKES